MGRHLQRVIPEIRAAAGGGCVFVGTDLWLAVRDDIMEIMGDTPMVDGDILDEFPYHFLCRGVAVVAI